MAGKWFEAVSFQRILSTVHEVRGNNAVHPFAAELSWTRHQLYIHKFFIKSKTRRNRMQGKK